MSFQFVNLEIDFKIHKLRVVDWSDTVLSLILRGILRQANMKLFQEITQLDQPSIIDIAHVKRDDESIVKKNTKFKCIHSTIYEE